MILRHREEGSLPLTGTTIKVEPKAYLKLGIFFEDFSEHFRERNIQIVFFRRTVDILLRLLYNV